MKQILSVNKYINVYNVVEEIFVILCLFVMCSAGTAWGYGLRRGAIQWIFVVVCILIIRDRKFKIFPLGIIYVIALLCNYFTSDYQNASSLYIVTVLQILSMSLLCIKREVWEKIFKYAYIWSLICSVSIMISVISPSAFFSVFWPLNGPSPSQVGLFLQRGAAHQYSGFAFEIAEAAVMCNIGIGYKMSRYIIGEQFKLKDVFEILLLFGGLILTTKRTLFVIPFVILAVFILLQKTDLDKKIKLIFGGIIIVGLVLIILLSVPQFGTILERFNDTDNIDSMGGREYLWSLSSVLFLTSPIKGHGYNTFNIFAESVGLPTYYGHNSYLQLLGEGGLVGAILILGCFYLASLIYSIYMARKYNDDYMIWYCLYLQIMLALYSITGNVLSYYNQLFTWILACIMVHNIGKQKRIEYEKSWNNDIS